MNKKKMFLGVCIVIAFVVLGTVTQVKARKVEQELKDVSAYINLVSSHNELDWEKNNLFLVTDFEIHAMGTQSYFVTPFWKGFITGAVDFGIEKLEQFPEDIWSEYDCLSQGIYYYPRNSEPEVDWKDNEHLAVSFDRPYTIEEVMEVEELAVARWFWIDTLGEEAYSQDGYIPSPGAENCAYGVTCGVDELSESCERWIYCLNSYEENIKTESGRKIYELKENMSGGESVGLEDIRILGCEIRAYGYGDEKEKMKENPMFHIVRSVNQ